MQVQKKKGEAGTCQGYRDRVVNNARKGRKNQVYASSIRLHRRFVVLRRRLLITCTIIIASRIPMASLMSLVPERLLRLLVVLLLGLWLHTVGLFLLRRLLTLVLHVRILCREHHRRMEIRREQIVLLLRQHGRVQEIHSRLLSR